MKVKNDEAARQVQEVAATMAIEQMYPSKEFLQDMLDVAHGKKTSDEIRQEVIRKYGRH